MAELPGHALNQTAPHFHIPRLQHVDISSAKLHGIVAPVALFGIKHQSNPGIRQTAVGHRGRDKIATKPAEKLLGSIVVYMKSRVVNYHRNLFYKRNEAAMPKCRPSLTGTTVNSCFCANGRVNMYEHPAPIAAPATTSHQSCFRANVRLQPV